MKKLMMLIAGGILSAALPLMADTETVDGIEWTYTVANGVASVGGGSSSSTAVPKATSGVITIPSTLGGNPGYPVTSIGNYAFYNCSGLTSVTIPDSVTNIGAYAFCDCWGLTSMTIPDGVTSIGDGAFTCCYNLTSVTIPDSVTSIGDWAFCECWSLTSVMIPNSVTSIGDGAFYNCSDLASVTIGNGVRNIGNSAFDFLYEDPLSVCTSLAAVYITDLAAWCRISFDGVTANPLYWAHSLYLNGELVTNLVIPDTVTNIGAWAFYNCDSLVNVTIPNSVTSIGDLAFYYCSGLTSVTIPDSVTSIGASAFYGCSDSLFDTNSISGVKLVDGWAVGNTDGLSGNINLAGVRGIGGQAFYGCSGLTSVTIPNSVTNIGSSAFRSCSGLTSVTIPDSVTSIGDYAFYYCSGLTSVTIGNSVTSIGRQAFYGCSGLTNITFMGDAPTVGSSAFSSVNSSCVASVSPRSTGWGVGVGEKWNGLTLQYWPEMLSAVASDAEVGEVVGAFADGGVAAQVTNKAEYDAFKDWVTGNNLHQPSVVANTNVAAAYLLGAERLFANAPELEIGVESVDGQAGGMAVGVAVTVKDGTEAVTCAAEKVKDMFEATGDLNDWDGAAKLTPTVTVESSSGATMRFTVRPGDGTASRAFLRIRK